MGKRGGRTKTTMPRESKWRSGETKTIRVPKLLAPQLLKIARLLDTGMNPAEYKLIEFLLLKGRQYQRSRKPFDRYSLRWSVFNEFENWLKTGQSKW